jgi:hypothetical protein
MDIINSELIAGNVCIVTDTLSPRATPLLFHTFNDATVFCSWSMDSNATRNCCKKLGKVVKHVPGELDDLDILAEKIIQLHPSLVVLDDVSIPLYAGVTCVQIVGLVQKLRHCAVVVSLHSDLTNEKDLSLDLEQRQLVNSLIHISTLQVSLLPLSSGHSNNVLGHVYISAGPRCKRPISNLPMERHLVFTDTTLQLIPKGSSV